MTTGPEIRADDRQNLHADPNAVINSQNVQELQLAWRINSPNYITHRPLVADGRVYFADWGGIVSAADARTGRLLWATETEAPNRQQPWHGFCGTGVLAEGKLFEASAEGLAFAFDIRNGKVLWRQRFIFWPEVASRGDLTYRDGLVYIPVSAVRNPSARNGRAAFQGCVVALSTADGHLVWTQRLASEGREPDQGLVGVMVPRGFALDPATGWLFLTTGHIRGLPLSVFTDSIMAIDGRDGAIHWSFPARAPTSGLADEVSENDGFGAAPQLFEAGAGNEHQQLVGAGDKSGWFWALEQGSGAMVWRTRVGPPGGGSILADAAIGSGRVLLWSLHPDARTVEIQALAADSGKVLWTARQTLAVSPGAAGFLARDIYLLGAVDGRVRAYRASNGRLIWTSSPTGPISSPLVVSGDALYFSVGTPGSLESGGQGGGVFAFSLPRSEDSGQAKTSARSP